MPIRVYYEVLNQKGTPALYSDNYAQRPAAGYQGRIFNSPDTGQIFYDTGTTWTLLADAGVGSGSLASVCANGNTTATGISITAGGLSTNDFTNTGFASSVGYVWFAGTGGQMTGTQSFFWDNNNKWLGLGTNTPTAPFDVHTTGNIGIQINNTTTADSKIAFLNADVGKWRIGNLYSGGANLFHIYNNAGSTLAMQINSSNAALFYGSLSANSFIQTNGGLSLIHNAVPTSSGYTGIGGLTAGLSIALASGFNQTLSFPTGVAYIYTFPSATGTIALTSNLGGTAGYLPKYASGTSLGQSLIYDTGSNIGINTSNPNYIIANNTTLDINGTNSSLLAFSIGGSARGYIFNTSTGQTYWTEGSRNMEFGIAGAGYMGFGTNNTERMRITSGGNVGIGTTSPAEKLDVVGGALAAGNGTIRTGITYSTYGLIGTYTNHTLGIITNGTEKWRIDTSGNFIGTSSGYLRLTGNNGMYFAVGSTITGGLGASDMLLWNDTLTGGIVIGTRSTIVGVSLANGATSWSAYSDERLKTNIENIDSSLDKLMTLRTIRYHLKDIDQMNDKKRLGLIAQDLLGKFDEVLDTDRSDFYQVRYTDLIPVLVKAVQELNQKIENLN